MKILILGSARHGKDTVAEMLKQDFGVNFSSSSEAAARIFIYDLLKDKYGYANFRLCYEDRINHRKEWHDLIVEYNKDDAAKLAKDILKENDCYVGMRSNRELQECKKQKLFDFIIGVYNPRVPDEDKESFDINFWTSCDIIIINDTSIDDLRERVRKVAIGFIPLEEKESTEEEVLYLVGYLQKPWGVKGFNTCEVGHPIIRLPNKQQALFCISEDGKTVKTVIFPSNTFEETIEEVYKFQYEVGNN